MRPSFLENLTLCFLLTLTPWKELTSDSSSLFVSGSNIFENKPIAANQIVVIPHYMNKTSCPGDVDESETINKETSFQYFLETLPISSENDISKYIQVIEEAVHETLVSKLLPDCHTNKPSGRYLRSSEKRRVMESVSAFAVDSLPVDKISTITVCEPLVLENKCTVIEGKFTLSYSREKGISEEDEMNGIKATEDIALSAIKQEMESSDFIDIAKNATWERNEIIRITFVDQISRENTKQNGLSTLAVILIATFVAIFLLLLIIYLRCRKWKKVVEEELDEGKKVDEEAAKMDSTSSMASKKTNETDGASSGKKESSVGEGVSSHKDSSKSSRDHRRNQTSESFISGSFTSGSFTSVSFPMSISTDSSSSLEYEGYQPYKKLVKGVSSEDLFSQDANSIDVHKCNSVMCVNCSEAKNPTFVNVEGGRSSPSCMISKEVAQREDANKQKCKIFSSQVIP